MPKILLLLIVVAICEVLLAFLFSATAQLFYKRMGLDFRSIIKGFIERLFLFLALVNNYPHALTVFSALKLATRLKHKELSGNDENRFNDYYLIGNLVSISFAIVYVYLYQNMETIPLLRRLVE